MPGWIGDQNNPNRDLSDPTWISVEGARALRQQRTNNFKKIETSSKEKKKYEMTPGERCYQILADSDYVRTEHNEHDVAENIKTFIDAGEGCPWLNPQSEIEKRQFETVWKNYFNYFSDEMIKYAKENPTTFKHSPNDLQKVGLHTMDDQGFEGQIIKPGKYYRWIEDDPDYDRPYKNISDSELESMWQGFCSAIQQTLTGAYNKKISGEESEKLINQAKEYQEKQEVVQKEITRRGK